MRYDVDYLESNERVYGSRLTGFLRIGPPIVLV
jgi:hypothetical protein